ncbi:MAG: acetyl-CoA carboxylase biotin carboxyl carrier protein subunit [Spirochaetaceae bacterium]|jgi:acetyl-CoA carboxylase biotin carboxyl carrier protein|nr:acetyl-CoA carboxylase biotin carboxyl carrier protein subunit [Spirochaetaceae bacterium]
MNEDFILRLMAAFDATGLAELELQEGSLRVALRKAAAFAGARSGRGGQGEAPPRTGGAAEPPAAEGAPGGRDRDETPAGGELITSPIVATFYASAGPDTPAFVEPGSRVKKGDTLCVLEAMKMMNHLVAEFDCEILEVRAASGGMVEFGQALFYVRRL